MAQRAGISGRAVALATAGGVLVYAGLRGENPLESLRGILTGSPPPVPQGKPVALADFSGGSFDGSGASGGVGSGAFPQLAQAATKYLGVKYRWGGSDPRTGLDCSGLVQVAFRDLGITAPRTSWTQRMWGSVHVVSDPGAGDLVWWPGHIGIMVDSKRMINAPHAGTVVRYANVGTRSGVRPTYLRYTGVRGAGLEKLAERGIR